jgi:hypothetical protein
MDVCEVTKEEVRGPGPRVQCLHMHMRLVSNSRDCGRARRALESNRVCLLFVAFDPLTPAAAFVPSQWQPWGDLQKSVRSHHSRTALRSSDTPRRALLSQHSTSLAFVSLFRSVQVDSVFLLDIAQRRLFVGTLIVFFFRFSRLSDTASLASLSSTAIVSATLRAFIS